MSFIVGGGTRIAIAVVVAVAAVGQGGEGKAEEEGKEEKSARQRRHCGLEGTKKNQTLKWRGGVAGLVCFIRVSN